LEGDERALFEVLFKQSLGWLVDDGTFTGCLTRRERPAPAELPEVALHRGEADTEQASGFALCPMPPCSTALTIFLLRSSE